MPRTEAYRLESCELPGAAHSRQGAGVDLRDVCADATADVADPEAHSDRAADSLGSQPAVAEPGVGEPEPERPAGTHVAAQVTAVAHEDVLGERRHSCPDLRDLLFTARQRRRE